MFAFLAVFLLSATTARADGLQKTNNGVLTHPGYQIQQENNNYVYYPYEDERLDDNSLVNNEEDKQGALSDEMKSENEEQESRRLFEWFSRLFQSTTPRAAQTAMTTTESSYQKVLKERIFLKALHYNLTDILYKLSDVEKRVAIAMEQKEAYAVITKGKPRVVGLNNPYYYGDRIKRDVANTVKSETVPKSATEKSVNNTVKIEVVNTTHCACDDATSGRRAGTILATPTEVKNKLLLYLQESFQEIKNKIISLRDLKQAFSDNISFKIGYILANIDTLEVSMFNLKRNMDKNKEIWEDNKILELYDTLKVSNQAVSGLIESVKVYLEKLSYRPGTAPYVRVE